MDISRELSVVIAFKASLSAGVNLSNLALAEVSGLNSCGFIKESLESESSSASRRIMWPISVRWELRRQELQQGFSCDSWSYFNPKNNSGEFHCVGSFPHLKKKRKKRHIKRCDIVVTTSHDAHRTNRKPLAVTCLLNRQCRSVIGPLFDQLMRHIAVFSPNQLSFFFGGASSFQIFSMGSFPDGYVR